MTFKIGDKVRMIMECSGCYPKSIYILDEDNGELIANKYLNGIKVSNNNYDKGCTCEDNWEPLTMIKLAQIALKTKS